MTRPDFKTAPLRADLVRAAAHAAAAPGAAARPVAETRTLPSPTRQDQAGAAGPEFEKLYSVVLIDDDEHTYQYVIDMLCTLFEAGLEMAYLMARAVDTDGRVVVCTAVRELACRKRDAIKSFGPDPLLPHSTGSMHAVIEPVQGR